MEKWTERRVREGSESSSRLIYGWRNVFFFFACVLFKDDRDLKCRCEASCWEDALEHRRITDKVILRKRGKICNLDMERIFFPSYVLSSWLTLLNCRDYQTLRKIKDKLKTRVIFVLSSFFKLEGEVKGEGETRVKLSSDLIALLDQ